MGDKIKKRMSMRYAGGDQVLAAAAPLPGQPSAFLPSDPYQNVLPVHIPGSTIAEEDETVDDEAGESRFGMFGNTEFAKTGFGGSFGGGQTTVQDERIRRRGAADLTKDEEWDLTELDGETVDVNAFVRRALTGADEDEVTRFKAALMRYQQANARELQRSVFKQSVFFDRRASTSLIPSSYAEFVVISKEISTLESDMLELKELLSQWKDLPQLMGMEDTLAPTVDKNGNRASFFPLSLHR